MELPKRRPARLPERGAVAVPADPLPAQDALEGDRALERHVLTLNLAPGEVAFVRRSSLMLAEGPFGMTTRRIASRRVPVLGLFSSQALWANRFEAGDEPVRLVAGRDYHGVVLGIDVVPGTPIHLQPALYLGHQGTLDFTVKRVARREFWTLTRVTGEGTLHLKAPGRVFSSPLSGRDTIVDTNYVAAVRGAFQANGRVFSKGQYLKSGEAENVRLTGVGDVLMQTELPPQEGGSGGVLGGVLDLFA
jgi:uncharacterized protein (AIM24 family)